MPKFGVGPADLVTGVIGKIDSSRFLELLSTDLLGMTVPQTTIEAVQRGPDAARETGIRNLCGMIGNMFFLGWVSRLFMKALGNRVNGYNPLAIPGAAGVNAGNLEAFGNLYAKVLSEPGVRNAAQARELLVRRFLEGLHSSDKALAKELFTKAAEADPQLKGILASLPEEGARGTLSDKARQVLQKHFSLEGTSGVARGGVMGTADLNAQAREILKHQRLSGGTEAKEFLKTRLRLSLSEVQGREKEWATLAEREALKGGLSGTVNWGVDDAGNAILKERSRETLLKDFKHFLEQFVDRANAAGTSRKWAEKASAIQKALFAKSDKAGLLGKFIPKAEDGLMEAALKAKWGLVRIPLMLTVASTISVAFLNNWLTRRKHGGKAFFPGEGGPEDTVAPSGNTAAFAANALQAPGMHAGSGLRRPGGFSQFQRGGTL